MKNLFVEPGVREKGDEAKGCLRAKPEMSDSSKFPFERTMIETGALLITLLFIIAQIGSKPGMLTASLPYLAALFVLSVMAAVVLMSAELGEAFRIRSSTAIFFLRSIEVAAFFLALVWLFILFSGWSLATEQAATYVILLTAVILIAVISTVLSRKYIR